QRGQPQGIAPTHTGVSKIMSMQAIIVALIAGIMIIAFVALVLLWAFTEELPRMERVPFYERLEAGEWNVRLLAAGRRQIGTIRVINEILGGDIGAAKAMAENPPVFIIEGINEALAREIVAELEKKGAQGEAVRR
ncbi:MAG: ribosomal protein L7/L12, partial [Ardenticatenaceae bacterium]